MAAGVALALVALGVSLPSAASAAPAAAGAASPPRFDHVVVVVLENKRYDHVIGHPNAPWVTSLAHRWANMTRFYAETHPSQPNYLALFSGSTQGVKDNSCPHDLGSRPNLARQLLDAGYSFAGYSEGLPRTGWRGCASGRYVRRHVPWVNFSNVPSSVHKPFTAFPSDYHKLPTVSVVIPDLCHDMHDCPKDVGDRWLKKQFAGYISWAATHNSLFIVTFDEDNRTDHNHIPTVIAGARVTPGQYSGRLDHYHLLRTLQAMYGLAPTGTSAARAPMRSVFSVQ
ncbi:alkaline phosphatase family protein [Krasilnikovia sp. MM14-A1259]